MYASPGRRCAKPTGMLKRKPSGMHSATPLRTAGRAYLSTTSAPTFRAYCAVSGIMPVDPVV